MSKAPEFPLIHPEEMRADVDLPIRKRINLKRNGAGNSGWAHGRHEVVIGFGDRRQAERWIETDSEK